MSANLGRVDGDSPFPGVDSVFVDRIRTTISERLMTAGAGLDEADEKQLSLKLISEELEAQADRARLSGEAPLDADSELQITQAVFDLLWALGGLQQYINDPQVTNVHVNGFDNVWVVYNDGTKIPVSPVAKSDDALIEMIRAAAAAAGRSEKRLDTVQWELHLQLADGARLHAVVGPTGRPVVTVRRHDFGINRLEHLVGLGVIDEGLAAFLSAAVRAKLNLIVSGGTNTGKTTMLRCLINEIPRDERVITVEDNLEIGLERFVDLHPDQVSWEARAANVEGKGEITLAECVKATLRQNPDRVIVGEIRGVEVMEMFRAMTQGNDGSMTSIHADSSLTALDRLGMYTEEAGLDPGRSDRWTAAALDLIIQVGWVQEARRVVSVREVRGIEGELIATNEIFRPSTNGPAQPADEPVISQGILDRLIKAGFDERNLGMAETWWPR